MTEKHRRYRELRQQYGAYHPATQDARSAWYAEVLQAVLAVVGFLALLKWCAG